MKILNLDTVKPTDRTLVISDTKYPVMPMTCGLFVTLQKLQEQAEELTPSEQIEQYIKIIKMLIPTLDDALLMQLQFEQLLQIIEFATDVANEENEQGAQEAAEKKAKA